MTANQKRVFSPVFLLQADCQNSMQRVKKTKKQNKNKKSEEINQSEAMQLVEVCVVFLYLHAAASEYAMHCEERNRQ